MGVGGSREFQSNSVFCHPLHALSGRTTDSPAGAPEWQSGMLIDETLHTPLIVRLYVDTQPLRRGGVLKPAAEVRVWGGCVGFFLHRVRGAFVDAGGGGGCRACGGGGDRFETACSSSRNRPAINPNQPDPTGDRPETHAPSGVHSVTPRRGAGSVRCGRAGPL